MSCRSIVAWHSPSQAIQELPQPIIVTSIHPDGMRTIIDGKGKEHWLMNSNHHIGDTVKTDPMGWWEVLEVY